MITYGHEKFIEQAINGVLLQETNFEIELIISNDCSTDKTDDVIQNILKTNPKANIINYFKLENNIGIMPNFIFAIEQCKGKFIALCEGDDYWTDPLKLQKQVDFFDINPDYILHSGNAVKLLLNSSVEEETLLNDTNDSTFVLEDFLSNNNLITCTVMFQNIKFQFPSYFDKVTFGDWFLYVILIHNSGLKAFRSTEIYSVYRIHDSGVMINLSELNICNSHILQIITIHKYLGYKKLKAKVKNALNYYFFQQYRLGLKEKLYLNALNAFINNFKYSLTKTPFKKYLIEIKQHIFII